MKSKHFNLTQKRLKEVINYDPDSGIFSWNRPLRRGYVYRNAGTNHPSGYIYIRVDKVKYRAHRLAWLWAYGTIPKEKIDHKNGVGTDNRIENLRLATTSQNGANAKFRSDNTSGFKGVVFNQKTNNWSARICINQKSKHIGRFDSDIEAAAMYDDAAIKAFGEFARTNVSYE